jgi:hypothetical protein
MWAVRGKGLVRPKFFRVQHLLLITGGDEYFARPQGACCSHCGQANAAGAKDEDGFASHELSTPDAVNGDGERLDERALMPRQVAGQHVTASGLARDELGEAAPLNWIHVEALFVLPLPAIPAGQAGTSVPEGVHGHTLAYQRGVNPRADCNDFSGDFVASGILVGLGLVHVHLQIRAAYACRVHSHHRIAWACGRLWMRFDDHPAHPVEKCRLHCRHT